MRKYYLVLLILTIITFMVRGFIKSHDLEGFTLDQRFNQEDLQQKPGVEFLKNNIISGDFQSRFPNLSIIKVRFVNNNRINTDSIEFRIKQTDSKEWFYKGIYKTDQFQNDYLFPFGFPTIHDAQGKHYRFEIESLNGSVGNAVSLSSVKPSWVVRSVFRGSEVIRSFSQLIYFSEKKAGNFFTYPGFSQILLLYFFPLTLYLLFLLLGFSYYFPVLLVFAFILFGYFTKQTLDYYFASVVFAWWLPAREFRFDSRISTSVALVFVGISVLFVIFKQDVKAEYFLSWSFLFFAFSTVQTLFGNQHGKSKVELKDFWVKLYQETVFRLRLAHFLTTATVEEIIGRTNFSKQATFLTSITARKTNKTVGAATKTIKKLLSFRKYLRVAVYAFLIAGVILLVRTILERILAGYQFYNRFFINDQWRRFVNEVGLYFLLADISLLLILFTALIFIRVKRRYKFVFIYLTLFSIIIINNRIFDVKTGLFRDKAHIWSVTPNQVSEIWTDITIRGVNFKERPFDAFIYVNNIPHRVISWTDKEVVFRTDPTLTESGKIRLVNIDGVESNEVDFTYTPPK